MSEQPRVSVLMPTYGHASFVRRAIAALLAQSLTDWELIIVDDASPDDTANIVAPYLKDLRISYERLPRNVGTGAALNRALDKARADIIAYLPSDDLYYSDHLESLVAALDAAPEAMLAYSGVRHHYNKTANGQIEGEALQPVQCVHRKTNARWMERSELVTDDWGRMLWQRLGEPGAFVATSRVTCEWVDHPDQLHKIIREPLGGINPYRVHYNVAEPLRFHTSVGNPIDEVGRYAHYRQRPDTPMAANGLKILLVGELAYNADRVLALEERGHKLYGLWTDTPYWFNAVGPLPFGHVTDLPRNDWQNAIRAIKPDVIYALLNWQTVPFAHHVLTHNPGVPFVWHFKEGPFISLEKGHWSQLVDLHTRSDAQIYSSPEMRDWFETIVPGSVSSARSLVLDGDLPKRDWFTDGRTTSRLSERDGQVHTVVPGRPIGLHPYVVGELAAEGIHLHFYGDFTHGQWLSWIAKAKALAPDHLHLHPNVDQENWVAEFSQYDAGWLHSFQSENGGDIRRANWDDLNYPARMATLAVSGIPAIQMDNTGAIVASQTLVRDLDTGVFYRTIPDLAAQLRDSTRLAAIRANVARQRDLFTFDTHADDLIAFLRQVVAG